MSVFRSTTLVVLCVGMLGCTSQTPTPKTPSTSEKKVPVSAEDSLRILEMQVDTINRELEASRVLRAKLEKELRETTGQASTTSTNVAALTRGQIPVGSIVPWWGSVANIPEQYELCDGQVITHKASPLRGKRKPDLRDQFLKGAARDRTDVVTNPTTGGQKTVSARQTGGTALTITQMPRHSHGVTDPGHSHGFSYIGVDDNPGDNADDRTQAKRVVKNGRTAAAKTGISINAEGGNQPHDHSIPSHDNQPQHVEVLFIIRVR